MPVGLCGQVTEINFVTPGFTSAATRATSRCHDVVEREVDDVDRRADRAWRLEIRRVVRAHDDCMIARLEERGRGGEQRGRRARHHQHVVGAQSRPARGDCLAQQRITEVIAVTEQQRVEPASRREREIEPQIGQPPIRDRALREVVGDRVVPELLGRLDLDGHPLVLHVVSFADALPSHPSPRSSRQSHVSGTYAPVNPPRRDPLVQESALGRLSQLSAATHGVLRGCDAVKLGASRNQLTMLMRAGVITRELPDTYRMTAAVRTREQRLRAALLWAGDGSAAAGRSAGELFALEGVRAAQPEIVVARTVRRRTPGVTVHRSDDRAALMLRSQRGLMTTGVEPTLVALAATLDEESFEIACEDARRRRLTSIPALNAYLDRFAKPGRAGVGPLRRLLNELDPAHAARSTLEVKTRRLLAANGISDFVREFPLEWGGRTYLFDFAFERRCTILETNGRRWHDDASDYERDNEKWSVPGRHGFRIVFATWAKVTRAPDRLIGELAATMAA